MALVRISEQLKTDIKGRVELMRKTAYIAEVENVYGALYSVVNNKFADYAEKLVWGDHYHLKPQMPITWCSANTSIMLHYNSERIDIMRPKQDKIITPPTISVYGGVPYDGGDPDINAHFERIAAKSAATKALTQKYEAIKAQLMAFLDASASLNKALKLFPDLALYVPKQYIDRVNLVVERSGGASTPKEGVALDVELLNSAAVMHALNATSANT